jgi:prepilin-type N-terminal cleavage/methylation domain-containing protein
MNKNKGFTLVELLAILVILAVIAVITVPRITTMIDDSKKDAVNVSALHYLDAVEKYYVDNSRFGADETFELNGYYDIQNGNLIKDEEVHNINLSGDAPKDGNFYISNGQVVNGCLTINKYRVIINNGSPETVEKGSCTNYNGASFIAEIEGTVRDDGYKYFTTPIVVYYNPDTAQKCNDYVSSNSNAGVKHGCMKWYIYNMKGSVINMLLDHNIADSVWCNSSDFENSVLVGPKVGVSNMGFAEYGNVGNNKKGPLTLLKALKENTSDWATSIKGVEYTSYVANTENSQFHLDYSDYKARIITAQEVAFIKGYSLSNWNESYSNDSLSPLPNWLKGTYYTISPNSYSSERVWYVNDTSRMLAREQAGYTHGVRPVVSESSALLNALINEN